MPSCSWAGRARACARSPWNAPSPCSRCSAGRCSPTCSSGCAEAGVTRVIFGCGYLPDPIQACFGERALGLELEYVVEPRRMGTAGGIRHAARGRVSDTFLALNGDILADAPLADLVAAHRACSAVATIALTPVEDPSRYGLVRTDPGGERARLRREARARADRHESHQRGRLRARGGRARPDRGRPARLDRARDIPVARRLGPVRARAGRLLVGRRHARELHRGAPRPARRAHPLGSARPQPGECWIDEGATRLARRRSRGPVPRRGGRRRGRGRARRRRQLGRGRCAGSRRARSCAAPSCRSGRGWGREPSWTPP